MMPMIHVLVNYKENVIAYEILCVFPIDATAIFSVMSQWQNLKLRKLNKSVNRLSILKI
jgi:hypothetical protein